MNDYLEKAILALKPSAQFTIVNNDFDTMVWHSTDIQKPTKKQVEQKCQELEDYDKQIPLKREKAISKLIELGLTEEEVKLLLS
jgi:hypothetical protein